MTKKYEIITKGTDEFTLKYKEKSFDFKTDISIMSQAQSYVKKGRMQMIKDLVKEGISVDQLTIKKNENGKILYDNSNKAELEKMYTNDAMNEVLDEICKKLFENTLTELIIDVGVDTEDEAEEFVTDLVGKLIGKTPSR